MSQYSDCSWRRPWWLAFLNNTNVNVTALTAVFLLVTHSAGVAYFCSGAVMCSITVKLVKKAVRQPRPLHPSQQKISYGYGCFFYAVDTGNTPVVAQLAARCSPALFSSHSMPSTHSATISYYATYFPLACAYDPTDAFLPAASAWRVFVPPIVVIWATLIALSRVWLGHHTWPQVAFGCLYGVAFACVWFVLWTNGLDEYGRLADDTAHSLVSRLQ